MEDGGRRFHPDRSSLTFPRRAPSQNIMRTHFGNCQAARARLPATAAPRRSSRPE
jgi:hypothetical protein